MAVPAPPKGLISLLTTVTAMPNDLWDGGAVQQASPAGRRDHPRLSKFLGESPAREAACSQRIKMLAESRAFRSAGWDHSIGKGNRFLPGP